MATYRHQPVPGSGDGEDDAARLQVALRWWSLYEFCCCHPVDDWSNAEPRPPGTYRALAGHYLAQVSEIVGYEVDAAEAARLSADDGSRPNPPRRRP